MMKRTRYAVIACIALWILALVTLIVLGGGCIAVPSDTPATQPVDTRAAQVRSLRNAHASAMVLLKAAFIAGEIDKGTWEQIKVADRAVADALLRLEQGEPADFTTLLAVANARLDELVKIREAKP